MKWIKASERLPLFSHRLISRFIHTKTPMFDFKYWALNNPDKLYLVEWLDESSSAEEAIGFAEWKDENYSGKGPCGYYHKSDAMKNISETEYYTIPELFQKYKQSKK